MNPALSNPIYQHRLVIFFDVLGWKNKIDRSVRDPSLLRQLNQLITLISTTFTNDLPKDNDVVWTSFSDNVVTSFVYDRNKLPGIIYGLCRLQLGMAIQGFYLRGGITIGNLLHLKDRVFGPALNRAYELESSHAVFPRIVLDPNEPEFQAISSICLSHDDQFTFLDPFNFTFIKETCTNLTLMPQTIKAYEKHIGTELLLPHPAMAHSLLGGLFAQVQAEYIAEKSEKVRDKYHWLVKRLTKSLIDAETDK